MVSRYQRLKILNQSPAIISCAAALSPVFAIFRLVPQSPALKNSESPYPAVSR